MDCYMLCFKEIRQFKHFEELIPAFQELDKKRIAHLNSTIVNHTNQSSMDSSLSSEINIDLIVLQNHRENKYN